MALSPVFKRLMAPLEPDIVSQLQMGNEIDGARTDAVADLGLRDVPSLREFSAINHFVIHGVSMHFICTSRSKLLSGKRQNLSAG